MATVGRRINVIGTSGSGKSTLARELSRRLGIPYIELDSIFWLPNWTERPRDEFRAVLAGELEGDAWVVDGNYRSKASDMIWPRVETIVWLDLPRFDVMRQIIHRTISRAWRRTELWNGNRESLRMAFSRDSIVWWAWTTHSRRRREYGELLRGQAAQVVILRSRAQVRRWLDSVSMASRAG